MIWLIGNKGMLGTEISLLLKENNITFIGTDSETDITDIETLKNFACIKKIKWIINCAAYTAVDKAEDDIENCRRLNTYGAANTAECAKIIGAKLIHISTDYVFDGMGIKEEGNIRPYRENDKTAPTGVYGLTKRDGEIAVTKNNPDSYIIRTAWLYGKFGNNFVHTMLKLMNERDEVKVVNDQRGSPTWTFNLATIILYIIEKTDSGKNIPFGIYHYTNEGDITWFDFAKEIYKQGCEHGCITNECKVKQCTSAEFPAKVKRPAYSVLDKNKITSALDITIPSWDASLNEFLKQRQYNEKNI